MAELLFELGCEELPASFVVPALDDMERAFAEQCMTLGISHGAIYRYGTPRRIALVVKGISDSTPDVIKEVLGPPFKVAFDAEGSAKLPAIKFAETMKMPLEDLKQVTTARGDYLAASKVEKGRPVIDLLPEVLSNCIRRISFRKSMRWADVEQTFGRPLSWIVALLGNEVVPVIYADVSSGRSTKGHRFLAPADIPLQEAIEYEAMLEKSFVMASIEKRREQLVKKIQIAAAEAGGTLIPDNDLMEQVLHLIELPCPLVGSFDVKHLDLPSEVLIQEMKNHQRYFSLNDASGNILPRFIAVSNTPVKDTSLSIRGYERVLQARLTDGRFFFDEDRRVPLSERVSRLSRRSWVSQLGSMAEKSERIRILSLELAKMTGNLSILETVERAAILCKADLETGMVGEFPELQGVMGREYALASGESSAVALAIFEHYLPRGASDNLPTEDAGALIGLADRLDSLCGLFGIGKRPTGARDDFALRRAAIGFIRIVISRRYGFSLATAIQTALSLFASRLNTGDNETGPDTLKHQLIQFFQGRLVALSCECFRADVVEAVMSVGFDDLCDMQDRLVAVTAHVDSPAFASLVGTYKRITNIIGMREGLSEQLAVNVELLSHQSERELHHATASVASSVSDAIEAKSYSKALSELLQLSTPVERFFSEVMVMAPESTLRDNRIRILKRILQLLDLVADFSKVQIER